VTTAGGGGAVVTPLRGERERERISGSGQPEGAQDKRVLVSQHPPSDQLQPHISLQEHASLARLIDQHAVGPSAHPWEHGGSLSRARCRSSRGCGEQGHMLVRRLFIPDERHCDSSVDVDIGEEGGEEGGEGIVGCLQGLVYADDCGSKQVSYCVAVLIMGGCSGFVIEVGEFVKSMF
jgi:hypothetical protein